MGIMIKATAINKQKIMPLLGDDLINKMCRAGFLEEEKEKK